MDNEASEINSDMFKRKMQISSLKTDRYRYLLTVYILTRRNFRDLKRFYNALMNNMEIMMHLIKETMDDELQ